jgi:hypothetical protein
LRVDYTTISRNCGNAVRVTNIKPDQELLFYFCVLLPAFKRTVQRLLFGREHLFQGVPSVGILCVCELALKLIDFLPNEPPIEYLDEHEVPPWLAITSFMYGLMTATSPSCSAD